MFLTDYGSGIASLPPAYGGVNTLSGRLRKAGYGVYEKDGGYG